MTAKILRELRVERNQLRAALDKIVEELEAEAEYWRPHSGDYAKGRTEATDYALKYVKLVGG